MDDLLDYSEPRNNNFKKAKLLTKVMAVAFILGIVCAFVARTLPRNSDTRNLIISLPFLLIIILAPIGLFYILRSYFKKENPTKRRIIYLTGIIFFNLLLLLFVGLTVRDAAQSF